MLRITQLGLSTFLNHWVLISSFRGMKQLGLFLLPLDGMQSISGTKFASIYNWLETGNVRVIKFLAQEYIYNTTSSAVVHTGTTWSKGELTT